MAALRGGRSVDRVDAGRSAEETAASVTLRANGPAVSWSALIGMTPARLHNPSVGLIPATPLAPEGQTIEPSVSVATAATARSAPATTPDPELEPHGLRSRT